MIGYFKRRRCAHTETKPLPFNQWERGWRSHMVTVEGGVHITEPVRCCECGARFLGSRFRATPVEHLEAAR